MNKTFFEIEMIKSKDTQETLSSKMGMSIGTLNKKLNSKSANGFTQLEMSWLISYWMLSDEDIRQIFFTDELS